MLYVEILYHQKFKPDQSPHCLTIWSDKPCQCCDSEHIDFDIYKLQQESFYERGRSLLFTDFRLAYRNMYRKPKDISSSDILHDLQSIRKKCAYSIHKNGTDNLNHIVACEYSKKERLSFLPPIVCHCIKCQYIPRSRCKCIHNRINKKMSQYISRHNEAPYKAHIQYASFPSL